MNDNVWQVADWRRQVSALYADVRTTADPEHAHATWVAGRDELLRHHPASPVPKASRADYPGAKVAEYDPAYRFEVPVDLDVAPETREVVTGTDGTVVLERCGRVQLATLGSLDVWWLSSYGGGIFIPMADSSPQSYGGGRYLIDTVKGADLGGDADRLTIDLNFAYQPSCAYDEAWACPLPGVTNRLDAVVPVGERYADVSAS